ncbi:MAG TPA: hypothetical protein VLI54_00480 [Bacillota bacterium]|nr:hypothetical protein [Bacillota bacterium]
MTERVSDQALNVADLAASFLGTTHFRRRYRPVRSAESRTGWRIRDVANNGDDSCAAFVSYVLVANNLLGRSRSTVQTMVNAMEDHGWQETGEPVLGGVAVWGCREDIVLDGSNLGHSGIYVGEGRFVSHSSIVFTPVEHPLQLSDGRVPAAYYTHDKLTTG